MIAILIVIIDDYSSEYIGEDLNKHYFFRCRRCIKFYALF